MDDLLDFDEPEDLATPLGVTLLAGALLAEEERCRCWCGCEREREAPDDHCTPCREGRHRDDTR